MVKCKTLLSCFCMYKKVGDRVVELKVEKIQKNVKIKMVYLKIRRGEYVGSIICI